MSGKVEIGWTTLGEDGVKRHVFATKFGGEWRFYERPKRKGRDIEWTEIDPVPLPEWLELLEALERRAPRDLTPPDQIEKVRRKIRELYPEHKFEPRR
jgi:hypothetical protein